MRTRPLITALLAFTVVVAGCGQTAGAGLHSGTATVRHRATAQHATTEATRHAAEANARAGIGARAAATGAAAVALANLPVKGRAPKTGYSREQFGDGWIDTDGCDTRDRILTRDLTHRTYQDDCRVTSGTLADPYTAARIRVHPRRRSEVDIDHVVALSDAWQKGAQQWSPATRVAFANDPVNLLAVDAHTNRSKGDGDAATWLPPNKRFRCVYVARQVAVKRKYKLAVTAAEEERDRPRARHLPRRDTPRSRRPHPGDPHPHTAHPGRHPAAAERPARGTSTPTAARRAPPASRRSCAAPPTTPPTPNSTATTMASPARRADARVAPRDSGGIDGRGPGGHLTAPHRKSSARVRIRDVD